VNGPGLLTTTGWVLLGILALALFIGAALAFASGVVAA